jgi:hypothetical protein
LVTGSGTFDIASENETYTITSYEKLAHHHRDDLLLPDRVQQVRADFRIAEYFVPYAEYVLFDQAARRRSAEAAGFRRCVCR